MATTTPNFGWPVPTSTDLVKDGATAIEALGDAIDASLVDLEGGTTGQILAKASNTDMDFAWITNDVGDITAVTAGTGISGGGTSGAVTVTNSMATAITTKGDLVPGTGSGTFARLAAGSNGDSLVVDSSTSTGLRYQGHIEAGKNFLINGGFDIWQRGTSSTASSTYATADRWFQLIESGSGTWAQETTVVPTGATYSLKFTASATSSIYPIQAIESLNARRLAGKTVTFSGEVAASTSTAMSMIVSWSTTVDNSPGGTWTNLTAVSGGTATPTTTTFVPISGVYDIPSTAKSIRVIIRTTSTIANGVVIYWGNQQLELGSVATTFSRAGGTIQSELANCQRYFQTLAFAPALKGISTTEVQIATQLSPMRATPTGSVAGAIKITNDVSADFNQSSGNITILQGNANGIRFKLGNFTGTVVSTIYAMYNPNGTDFIKLDSEL